MGFHDIVVASRNDFLSFVCLVFCGLAVGCFVVNLLLYEMLKAWGHANKLTCRFLVLGERLPTSSKILGCFNHAHRCILAVAEMFTGESA